MRKSISITVVMTVLLFIAGGFAQAQDAFQQRQASTIVINQGIAYKHPGYSFTFFDEFLSDSLGLVYSGWVITNPDDSTLIAPRDSAGGVISISPIAGVDNRATLQNKAEIFKLSRNSPMKYQQRVMLDSSMINAKIFLGLSIRNTSPADSLRDTGTTDGIYFYKAGGDTLLYCRTVKSHIDSATNVRTTYEIPRRLGGIAWITLGIEWDGAELKFLINGSPVAWVTNTNYIPSTELAPTIAFNNSLAGTRTLLVDYVYGEQVRASP